MLAYNDYRHDSDSGQHCGALDGGRKLWNLIWTVNFPPKVQMFAWGAASDSLVIQTSRQRHPQVTYNVCNCGSTDKNDFHAFITCPKVWSLCMDVKNIWNMLEEGLLVQDWPNWLLLLLDNVDAFLLLNNCSSFGK